jgi:dihydroorotate dehydrogenase (NAD+) catalytic subunit
MADLATQVADLRLPNPTMLASGFLDETGGSLLRVHKSGAGAVVTKSIGPAPREGYPNPTLVEVEGGLLNAVGLPNPGVENFGPEVKTALDGGAVVVGSVYGKDAEEFASVSKRLAAYGVHAVELNLSCPHAKGLGTEIAQHEEAVRDFTAAVKGAVDVPVFPKLSPNVANIASFAQAAADGGADGVVAINTVKAMAIAPEVAMPVLAYKVGGLSGPAIRPIGVRCVYEIHAAVDIPVIGVGGVATGRDALEYIMAGASAVQIGTAILSRGVDVFRKVCDELAAFMDENGYGTVGEMVGLAHA